MNIRIFAAGYLATNFRHGREIPITYGINENELNRRVHKIQSLLNDLEGTNSQKALRYGLSNKNLSTIIIGLETISHLEEALKANQMGPLDTDTLNKILNLQRKILIKYKKYENINIWHRWLGVFFWCASK